MDKANENILEQMFLTRDENSLKDKILFEQLSLAVNNLIQYDFHKLISILYRIDVSEKKLTEILHTNKGLDAGNIIATLMIERQLQKIKSRKYNQIKHDGLDDKEERW